MRSLHPYSILHLHAEGAVALTHKPSSDGSLKPHFFYQSPKATGSLEMALKRFFAESRKDVLYINLVSEFPSVHSFKDTTLLKDTESFTEVIEANSGLAKKDCDVQFLETDTAAIFEGNSSLLVNCSRRSDFLRAQALASELDFESFELFNNTLSTIGALTEWRDQSQSRETVAILEIGTSGSSITVSTVDGQLKSRKAAISTQDIAESIQKNLKLKFESAALLLFYNGIFDFSQHTQAIAESFASKLAPILMELEDKLSTKVDRLLISSLPPSFRWVSEEVPKALGLNGFTTDDFKFLKDFPLLGDCSKNTGFVGFAFAAHSQSGTQLWMSPIEMQLISVACKMNAGFGEAQQPNDEKTVATEPIPKQTEAQAAKQQSASPVKEKKSAGIPHQFLQPEEESFDIFGDDEIEEIIFEAQSKKDPIEVISLKEQVVEEPTPAPQPKVVITVDEEENDKTKLGLIFTGLAALVIVGCGGLFFIQNAPKPAPVPIANPSPEIVSVAPPKNEYEAFKVEANAIINEEPAEAIAAVSKPAPEPIISSPTDAPKIDQETVELIEFAESELPEAIVPAPAPMGRLSIESNPPGATVFVNSINKGVAPVTVDEVVFGHHTLEFKLDGYVAKLIDINVESTDVVSVGATLDLPLGNLEVNTTPSGVDFQIISVDGLDKIIHSGVTPATVTDLMRGPYEIVFTRDDWESYSESATVKYDETSVIDLIYPEGWIMVTSNPDGASVFEKGVFIGKTPLRVKGLKEGEKTYTLRSSGYEDLQLTAEVVAQSETRMSAELLSWDREVDYKQLDILPAQTKGGLSSIKRFVGGDSHRFLVEFVISAEGNPEQIEILETTYLRGHDRLIKDISEWKFEPGIRKDHAVKTRARIPVVLGDPAKLPPAVELARIEDDDE